MAPRCLPLFCYGFNHEASEDMTTVVGERLTICPAPMTPRLLTSAALRRAVQLKARAWRAAPSIRIRAIEPVILMFVAMYGKVRTLVKKGWRLAGSASGNLGFADNESRATVHSELEHSTQSSSPRHFTRATPTKTRRGA